MSDAASLRFPIRTFLFWGVGLLAALGLFTFVRDLTVCWRLTSLPGIPPASCAGRQVNAVAELVIVNTKIAPTSTPEAEVPVEVTYPTWDGASRINILFVGLRGGDPLEGDCPFCTDTLILLTVDPLSKTAGMLSIPRDMWVNIPGFGFSRINTAWTLGRGSKLPGGGPALAMKTVSQFIGVPVDYYVQVDFDTFVDVIDMLGGVDIQNDETLFLDPVYHGREFPKVKLTCCGMRHFNGRVALAYARCRHAEQGCDDGDIGRARRQQKVIFAIRDKVLNPQNFPRLLSQATKLYGTFYRGIQTNMTLQDASQLAALMREIPRGNIRNEVIDNKMIGFGSVTLGGVNASVIRPLPDQIRILRDQLFTTRGALRPLAKGDLITLMYADRARLRILNGTSSPDLDTRTANFFTSQGMVTTEIGDIPAVNRTTIILYKPKLYTLRYLVDLFGITNSTPIRIRPDPAETVDIEIRLGPDWVKKLPKGELEK